jgi:hypothetical protein
MKKVFYIIIVLAVTALSSSNAMARPLAPFIDFEGGLVYGGYNDARIPGDIGTKISFTDDLDMQRSFFFRMRAGITIFERHTVSFLFAPLRVYSDGYFPRDVYFHRGMFAALNFTEGRFRFDSYRLTYRYDIINGDSLTVGAGLTLKIRDASIRLRNINGKSERSDLGFVPLINLRAQWRFVEPLSLLLDADALWAPQGRAEDILLALQVHVNQNFAFRVGYRMLEGGADNDTVYTFSLFHYAIVGFTFSF